MFLDISIPGRYKRDVTDGLIGQRHFPQTPRICKEICEYETTEVCADFPEVECEKECICEPSVECTPIEHIGCSFVKEKIKTKEKLYGNIIGGARNVKVKNSLQQIVIVLHVFQLMVPTIDGFR